MPNKIETKFEVRDQQEMLGILGKNDELLRIMQDGIDCVLVARGNVITVSGDAKEVELAAKLIEEMLYLYRQGLPITSHEVSYSLKMLSEGKEESLRKMDSQTILVTNRGRQVKAKTMGQLTYLDTIENNVITIGIGPAGTGKTYLAVAMAVKALRGKEVERIILTRPAVEAGEKLGFLPGDLQEKVDPYLRPLYDALYEMLGLETFQKYLAKGILEVAPLAYMRGR